MFKLFRVVNRAGRGEWIVAPNAEIAIRCSFELYQSAKELANLTVTDVTSKTGRKDCAWDSLKKILMFGKVGAVYKEMEAIEWDEFSHPIDFRANWKLCPKNVNPDFFDKKLAISS